jgi:hypothetical protein
MSSDVKPGPTGDFPAGKLNDEDEGGLRIAVGSERGNVVIAFGKPVAWIGMPPQEAADLATMIIRNARAAAKEAGALLTISL